ncbi:MAG: ATP-binding protein, partial [Anaerolineae bacterium]|nr:ATP-binding protein [Anaerolineae bacterium]
MASQRKLGFMPDTIPYHPLSPPDDPTLFFGREDVIAFLRQHLVGANNTEVLVILGRAGIGKTSVLQHVPYIVDERYQPVYMDADSLDNLHTYLTGLASRIVQRMELIGASTYRVPDLPPDSTPPQDLLKWFALDFLDVVLAAISRSRFLLLLLDDLHRLFDAVNSQQLPANFIDYLGDLLRQHDRLSIVAGLHIDYEDQAMRYAATASILNHFRLQHLDEPAARQVITE